MSRSKHSDRTAGAVLHAYLEKQLAVVVVADDAVRRHDPRGLKDLRVGLRRLRTSLATYRPLLDREVTDPLRDRMQVVARGLGGVRDDQVVHSRLWRLVDEEPAELGLGSARRLVGDEVRAAQTERAHTTEVLLGTEEWRELRADLTALVAGPAWLEAAERRAVRELPRLLRKDLRRLRRASEAADATFEDHDAPHQHDVALHEIRKSAKRLRHACEVAAPVLGKDADRLRVAAKRLQAVLGAHHDTVVTRAALVRLAGRADLHPGTAFTLGRLHAREAEEAEHLDHAYIAAWHAVRRAGRRL
jgi:CHAD domain-containing protein